MSGIYIHVPFCKKACHYCNFHFSTTMIRKDEMVEAICNEIDMRHAYLLDKNIQSIYFGGGTPSVLNGPQLEAILRKIGHYFDVSPDIEITLECNPDDLSKEYLRQLKDIGINRLSIGIQSFFQEDLTFMNRAHDAHQARQCIEDALSVGFNNLTIDLIYGCETTSEKMWQKNIEIALSYEIPHLSSYALTIEEGTAFGSWVKRGKISPANEDKASYQFDMLMHSLTTAGYLHYEISNFAKEGHIAVHNTNYWKGAHYLGIGPSAHSFDGTKRSWNVANNVKYMKAILDKAPLFEEEMLSKNELYNEYVMTGLRTMWGIDLTYIHHHFGELYFNHISSVLEQETIVPYFYEKESHIVLNDKGRHFADRIASECFMV